MNNDTAEWLKKVPVINVKKEIGVSFEGFEAEEMDSGEGQKIFSKAPKANVIKKLSYGSKDLRGLKVSHGLEDFKAGQSDILVLADSDVLNESSHDDTLISMSIREDERLKRLREVERHAKGYSGYKEFEEQEQEQEEADDDSVITFGSASQRPQIKKKILQKYDFNSNQQFKDEPEYNSSCFVLGNEAKISSLKVEPRNENKSGFDTVTTAGVDTIDLSLILNKRKSTVDTEKARKRAKKLTKNLFSDEPEMMIDFEENSVVKANSTRTNFKEESDDDFDMQRIISATRKEKLSLNSQYEDINMNIIAKQPLSIIQGKSFDSFMTVGTQDLNEEEQGNSNYDEYSDTSKGSFDQKSQSDNCMKTCSGDSEADTFILSAEPLVRNGLASTLALLNMKGINLHARSSKKDQDHKNINSSAGTKSKNTEISDIKLEYFDQFGNKLNTKEAYKELSRKFHGKGPGKSKLEKMKRKRDETRRIEEAPVSESSAHSALVTNLKIQQQHTGEAHMVISNIRTPVTAIEPSVSSYSGKGTVLDKQKQKERKIFGFQVKK